MAQFAIIAAVTAAASMASALQQSAQSSAQADAAGYNVQVLKQQGIAASNTAAANMAESQRKSAAALGEQAAAFGQSEIGTGGSVQNVEKQSATNARMDQLNIWYGGELERHQAFAEASAERYKQLLYKRNADAQLYGGIGTSLLTGASEGYRTASFAKLGSGSGGGII
jgi:hypothetical protein